MPDYLVTGNEYLKPVYVFYPKTNQYKAALFDSFNSLIIGFNKTGPYHPVGGMQACIEVIETGGLVVDSEFFGFNCRHCHSDVYRIVAPFISQCRSA